ncbi:MAG TPA: TPM domain-containing protein [Vicinamibacterales bacterium]
MSSSFVTSASTLALLITVVSAQAQGTLPKPAGRVTDLANVIDAATEADLDRRLDELERQTSSEVAVVTVTSLNGVPVEDYALQLFKEWGIGQAKTDNGVLVLVAPNEREMRIEVGYGLEGILPDGLAGQIIRENFIPRFRDDDYNGGIRDGVARVIDVVEKQQVLSAEELAKFNDTSNADAPVWIIIPFMGLFVAIGFLMVGIGLRTRTGFPLLFGSFFGGMPLLLALGIVTMVASVTLLPLAIGMAFLGFRLGNRQSWRDAFRNKGGKGGGSSGGWVMGGGSSSGSSSSSSGGSSSSFGGGSSGGGGASGRW